MPGTALRIGRRPRGFVGVSGPDAASYLERMLSNEVESLEVGDSCEALLLTPKGRVIAPMTVWRRAPDDFLLLTEPDLVEQLQSALLRSRLAAKVAIERERHSSVLVLGGEARPGAVANREYGVPAYEVLDDEVPDWREVEDEELESMRIRAGTPRFGHEIDDRVLPAEAGLDERAISFTKGCYPGQEPVARLHYRGHPNRSLRVLCLEGSEAPPKDADVVYEGKTVGRITSAARDPEEGIVALAYVRREVPPDAVLELEGRELRPLDYVVPRP